MERRDDKRPSEHKRNDRHLIIMKLKVTLGAILVGALLSAMSVSLIAQNCPGGGPNGKGYGGPPKTEQERAARQAACLQKNGGVCPNGGPQANCQAGSQKQCKGGKGWGKGLRDGTGPRNGSGTCPMTAPKSESK